jgi:hypothetical protein
MGHRLFFLIRMTYKNIIRYRLRGILMFFSFTMLLVTLFLGFSMNAFSTAYYTEGPMNTYAPYDLTMGVNTNSNTRYFSTRQLMEAETTGVIEAIVPFFEVSTMASNTHGVRTYVTSLASTLDALRSVTNGIPSHMTTLGDNDVIITRTLATSLDLSVGSPLAINVGNAGTNYQVSLIIEDNRLFRGDTLFVNKASSIRMFISAISPELSSLPDIFFTNIHNRVYLASADGKHDEAFELLSSLDAYQSLEIKETVNLEAIDQLIRRSTSVFNVIFWMMVATVIFVMQTTFLLFFEEKRQTFAITSLLGGKPGFSYLSVMIETAIYFLVALFVSIHLSNLVFRFGIAATSRSFDFSIPDRAILTGILIAVLIFLCVAIFNLMRMPTDQLIRLSKAESGHPKGHITQSISLFVGALIFYITVKVIIAFDESVLIEAVLLLVMGLALLRVMSVMIASRLQKTGKRPLLGLFMRVLISKKAFSRWLSVMMISVLSIFLLVQTHHHISQKIDRIEEEFVIDFALINIMNRYLETANELAMRDDIDISKKAMVLNHISISGQLETLSWMYAIEDHAINQFFDFGIPDDLIAELDQDERLVILLPMRYKALLGYDVGDVITFDLAPKSQSVPMTIVGFFAKEIGDTAFTNLRLFDTFDDLSDNAILINAKDDREELKDSLIDDYAPSLVVVLDFEDAFEAKQIEISQALGYVTLILGVMIGCFVLAVVVHTILLFEASKQNISRLMVLGVSKSKAQRLVILEKSVFLFLIFLISGIILILLIGLVSPLVIYFNDYELVVFSPLAFGRGMMIALPVYAISVMAFLGLLHRTHPSYILRSTS